MGETNMLDAEGKWRKEEQLRQKREEQNALRVKVVKYEISRPTSFISQLFGSYLKCMDNEEKLLNGDSSILELKEDAAAGGRRPRC